MPDAIDITNRFPPTRERTVLLELLRVVRSLQKEGIEVVICGGWVPFLKQLARENRTEHLGSLDIDSLFRQAAREPDVIDQISRVVVENIFPRGDNDDSVRRIQGIVSSLELCLVDGAENLAGHIETIRISWLEGDETDTCDITIPDSVGFLMLKAEVCRYRETTKDPYDIYYYCRYSEEPDLIRQRLGAAIGEPAVRRTIDVLRRMFRYEDSKWVDLALDHMSISGEERDREARFIVRSMARAVGEQDDELR